MEEIWKDIIGYEGLYQVSNWGRIKSLNYEHFFGPKVIKPTKRCGYYRIGLYKNGKQLFKSVHRLVWEAFNGPIPKGMQVNHINEDKTDNRLENLNLMSPKENSNWGTRTERQSQRLKKPVKQYSKDGEYLKTWESASDIEKSTGFKTSHISNCCNGKFKTAYGFLWSF